MEVNIDSLRSKYAKMGTQELIQLSEAGELTEVAKSVLNEVLKMRGMSSKRIEEQKNETRNAEIAAQTEIAIKQIKNAVYAIYVISSLQIAISLVFPFWLGVFYGILLAAFGFLISSNRSPFIAVNIILLGSLATIVNLLGPMVTSGIYGNMVLSVITMWLGFRCYKAARLLAGHSGK